MQSPWLAYLPWHIANDLIQHPDNSLTGRSRQFEAVVLFVDISGFTRLSEALGENGKTGTEELTDLLNLYYVPMIALIQSYGGIVGKFGGDSLTILWDLSDLRL